MFDPEYVERIDCEMKENGGQLAPDDHEAVWANLKSCSEWAGELEFAISLLTAASLAEVREMVLVEAAKRHPALTRQSALAAEIRIRDAIERAADNRKMLDEVARIQRDPAVPMDLFDDDQKVAEISSGGRNDE